MVEIPEGILFTDMPDFRHGRCFGVFNIFDAVDVQVRLMVEIHQEMLLTSMPDFRHGRYFGAVNVCLISGTVNISGVVNVLTQLISRCD